MSNKNNNKNKTQTNKSKPRNYVAIYYKSNGKYVGPWGGSALKRSEFEEMRKDGTLHWIKNHILHSPLQFRYQTTA